ncbi:helix-turn-helix domain-containing protein [Desulfofundulus luciae]|uniref:helix-turn-helix domain-containing protein n=1 Tax=Desulfofundulus luciae TaxID=74702 RepID=UPI0027D8BAD4|nr:helix-turn-helix domain-containing protein [Desulfofundulus luciae]
MIQFMPTEREIEAMSAFLTVEEAAGILRLKRSMAYEYVRQGIIPSIRLGNFIRVPKARLLELAGMQDKKPGEANF